MRGLRIAMVSEHASPLAAIGGVDAGGQNVHVANLAAELGLMGHEVVVHTRRDDPSLPEVVPFGERIAVHHVDAGPPSNVGKDDLFDHMGEFAAQLHRCWRSSRPDVVHAHFWMSGHAALAAARPLGIPVVQTFHALGVVKQRHQAAHDTSPPVRIAVERELIRSCDRIIATCSDEVFELVQLGGRPERLVVVPCGVNPHQFSPDGPAARRPSGRRRVLYVGRLVERKGIGTAIEAMAPVSNADLVVAGGPAPSDLRDDPDVVRLRQVAARCGSSDRVEFVGRVDRTDLPALFRSADLVVCLPWYEPFGIVPLEAMGCGVPVVASAVGGLIDTVVDGVTGRLVPPRDVGSATAVIEELLDQPLLRSEMGRAGAKRVRGRYSWSRVARDTLQVYASVVRSVRPARSSASPVMTAIDRLHAEEVGS